MKKYRIIIVVVFIIILIIGIVCGILMHKNKKYGSIVISNGSAVTSWKTYVIEDPNIIKNVRIKDVGKKYKDEEGGNSDKEYKFKALKEGKTKIYIFDVYYFEESLPIEKVYDVIVDKDLNVSISESNDYYKEYLGCIPMNEECEYTIGDESILKCLEYCNIYVGDEKKGYILEGCKPGETTISFNTNNGIKVYNVKVNENLNISFN